MAHWIPAWMLGTESRARDGAPSVGGIVARAVSLFEMKDFGRRWSFTLVRFWWGGRWVAAFLVIIAYLLYPAAVAFSVYSALFESSKVLALAGLALAAFIAVLTFFTVPFFLDGLLLLPFWFLAAMGIVKFVRRRNFRRTHLTEADS